MDTSNLIKNEQDLLATTRVACLFSSEEISNLVGGAPQKSILWRAYHEKMRLRADMVYERTILNSDRCVIPRDSKVLGLLESDFFILAERNQGNLFMASSFLLQGIP